MKLFSRRKKDEEPISVMLKLGGLMDFIQITVSDLTQFHIPYHNRDFVQRRLQDALDLYKVMTNKEYELPQAVQDLIQRSTQDQPLSEQRYAAAAMQAHFLERPLFVERRLLNNDLARRYRAPKEPKDKLNYRSLQFHTLD